MQEFGTHLGGTKLECTPPCIWVGVIMAPTVEARAAFPAFFGCIHFIKKRNSGYVSGRVFPGSHVDSCWDHAASQADDLLPMGRFPQFLFWKMLLLQRRGARGPKINYTPNLFFSVFS